MKWTDIATLISPSWSAINAYILAGVVGILLAQKGVGHRRLLWVIFTYFISQGFRGMSIALSVHEHRWTYAAFFFRLAADIIGSACVWFVIFGARDICRTLVESQSLQVERDKKETEEEKNAESYRNIIVFGSRRFADESRRDLEAQRGH